MEFKNKSLKLVPQPENVEILQTEYGSFSKAWVNYLPYSSFDWKNAVQSYKIQVPEKFLNIINRADGISTCPECGHRVAGHQMACDNKVFKYHTSSYNRGVIQDPKKFLFKGDKIISGWSSETVSFTQETECKSQMQWDKLQEFNEQQDFFSWLENLERNSYSNLTKYGELVGDKNTLMSNLQSQLDTQRLEIEQLKCAITTIAGKMNQAGGNLMF